MPSRSATRRASSTAPSEQQPPCRALSSSSPRGHCCRVIPTTSWLCSRRSAAATLESTPPDRATATFIAASLLRRGLAPPGHGGDDGDLVRGGHPRIETPAHPHVLVVQEKVHELPRPAL